MSKETYTYKEYLTEAKFEMNRLATEEERTISKKDFPWKVYNSSLDKGDFNYELTFSTVLEGRSFKKILQERKRKTGTVFGLDIMGTTDFPEVDGQVSMTLVDIRTEDEKSADIKKAKSVIPGNILEYKPWHEAANFIKRDPRETKGFDLVVCRPILGWTRMLDERRLAMQGTIYESTERIIVQRAINLANPSGGETFMQFRGSKKLDYPKWLDALNKMPQFNTNASFRDSTCDVILNMTRTGINKKINLPHIPQKP